MQSIARSFEQLRFGLLAIAQALVRQFGVGLADGVAPNEADRNGSGGLVEHHQPFVLVVEHDTRRQRIDRFLKQIARMLDLHLALLEVGDVDPETDRPAGWRELLRPFEPALADCLAHDLRALAAETRDPFLGCVLERRAELLRELGGFPRQLLVGDADDAGPLQQRRRDDGGGIEHLQPLVLVVDHDARRQAVDRLLQEVARLSGGPPLPLMLHRGVADQQDQHQPGGDEPCRAERQDKQRQPVVVDQLADQRIDAARIRSTCRVQASELTITRPSVARSSRRSGGAKAAMPASRS